MVVGARRAGLSISKTADLLAFSSTTISNFELSACPFSVSESECEQFIYPVSVNEFNSQLSVCPV